MNIITFINLPTIKPVTNIWACGRKFYFSNTSVPTGFEFYY